MARRSHLVSQAKDEGGVGTRTSARIGSQKIIDELCAFIPDSTSRVLIETPSLLALLTTPGFRVVGLEEAPAVSLGSEVALVGNVLGF